MKVNQEWQNNNFNKNKKNNFKKNNKAENKRRDHQPNTHVQEAQKSKREETIMMREIIRENHQKIEKIRKKTEKTKGNKDEDWSFARFHTIYLN